MPGYAYFWGCYIPARLPHMEKATRVVFEHLGVDAIDIEGLTCCPEKTMIRNMSRRTWLLTAARNLAVAEETGRALVTPCTGCFSTLREAAVELRSDPAQRDAINHELARIGRSYRGGAEVVHVLDVLYQDLGPGAIRNRILYPMTGMQIAVHYGCHLLRPSESLLFDDPFWPTKFDQLLEALGAESVTYSSKMDCCGNLLLRAGQQESSEAMCRAKLRDISEAGADALTLVCPSCMLQYDNVQYVLQRAGEDLHLPVFYYPQLLGLALGLEPEAVGIDRHRIDAAPFLAKWESRRRAIDEIRRHWDYDLLQACAQCGACAEDCPVARADPEYNPNELVRALVAGDLEAVLASPELWKCVECYTCAELCPNKYDQMAILRVAKHLAMQRRTSPPAVTEGLEAFRSKARLIEASAAQRRRLGLPPALEAPSEELRALLGGEGDGGEGQEVEQ